MQVIDSSTPSRIGLRSYIHVRVGGVTLGRGVTLGIRISHVAEVSVVRIGTTAKRPKAGDAKTAVLVNFPDVAASLIFQDR